MLLYVIKSKLKLFQEYIQLYVETKRAKNKKIFLLMTPRHGNLGDHAIALGEYKFFDEHFSNVSLIEVSSAFLNDKSFGVSKIKKIVASEDLVVIHAGGYLGTLWFHNEVVVRNIINCFRDKRIIFMPNTIYYHNNEFGNNQLKISADIYNQHGNISLYVRENQSKQLFENTFYNTKVTLVPDMAFYLSKFEYKQKRKGILLCLRNDCEKTRTCDEYILETLKKLEAPITFSDMCIDEMVSKKRRKKRVEEKFMQFASSELVVTDRLHGMIFSVITQTPCVIINSQSHKVSGVYEWVKDYNYIEFVNDISLFQRAIKNVMSVHEPQYDNSMLKLQFSALIDEYQKILK